MWLLCTLIRSAARLEENKSNAWSERQQIDLHQVAAAAVSGATRPRKSSLCRVLKSQRMNHLLRWLRHCLGKNHAPAPAGWGDLISPSRCVSRSYVHKLLRKKNVTIPGLRDHWYFSLNSISWRFCIFQSAFAFTISTGPKISP